MPSLSDAIRLYHAAVGNDTKSKRVVLYVLVTLTLSILMFAISRFSGLSNYLPQFDFNRSFSGYLITISDSAIGQMIDFIAIFCISLGFTHIIVILNPNKDNDDVYTPIRKVLAGQWRLTLINFMKNPNENDLCCNVELYISKNTQKMRAKFYNSNQLDIICNVLSVSVSVQDDATVDLQIIADQIIYHDNRDKTFKYLIQLRGADNADGGYPHFQGTWYMLEDLGADSFRPRGLANMIRNASVTQSMSSIQT